MLYYRTEEGIVLKNETLVDEVAEAALKAIEKGLANESGSYEQYAYVIGRCKELLDEKKIVL